MSILKFKNARASRQWITLKLNDAGRGYTLGRDDADCPVRVRDAGGVEDRVLLVPDHCVDSAPRWVLVNCGDELVTINGHTLPHSAHHVLADSDEIRLGDSVLLFFSEKRGASARHPHKTVTVHAA